MSIALRAVLRNALALLLAYVIPRSLMLVAIAVAARVLGTHAFGLYGTAAAFAVILSIASTLGMQPLLVRELARAPDRAGHLLRSAMLLKTAANVVMLALLIALAVLLRFPTAVLVTALVLGIGYALGSYGENLAAWFQSQERMHVWTQASALFGLVAGLGGAAIVALTGNVVAFAVAVAGGQLAALSWLAVRAAVSLDGDVGPQPQRPHATREDVRRLAREAAPFALAFIALTLYCKLDVLLLAWWRGAGAVGLYTAAYKFVDVTQALVIVAAGAVLPRLARSTVARGGPAGARTIELAALTAVPIAGALLLARGPVVHVVFGSDYAAAAPAVGLLAAMLPLLALNITAGYVLGIAGAMRAVARSYALALVMKIALGAVLITRFGATGAAAAALAAELMLAPMLLHALARAGTPVARRALALAGIAAAIAGALALLPDGTGGIGQAVLAFIAVAGFYARAQVLSPVELNALAGALGSWRSRRERIETVTADGAV